jgi:hypothetical protein
MYAAPSRTGLSDCSRSTTAAARIKPGPTWPKIYSCVLLRGGFTRVEQTLLAGGRGEDVIRQRMAFQDVMRERFERVVEEATGRQVVGFMSGNQQDPDMICEVFVLAPNDVMH